MSIEDIPEALREKTEIKAYSSPVSLFSVISAVIALSLMILGLIFLRSPKPTPPVAVEISPSPVITPTPSPVENILGHLPYSEAPSNELKPITANGELKLRSSAAQAFLRMQGDARANGVILVPISGFRTVEQQNHLFFDVKAQRNQDTHKRAEVSAPPGYSEHHTGYAVDIGDGKAPTTNLSQSFENTAAFQWLTNNAARYNFELSFPPDNPQGISYEPWHWRYVGDKASLETFYKAQQLKQGQ